MRPFGYRRASGLEEAARAGADGSDMPPVMAANQFVAGGTIMLDLMKLDVMLPDALVDINALARERTARSRRIRAVCD